MPVLPIVVVSFRLLSALSGCVGVLAMASRFSDLRERHYRGMGPPSVDKDKPAKGYASASGIIGGLILLLVAVPRPFPQSSLH